MEVTTAKEDHRDSAGIRRWVTSEIRRDAEAIHDEKRRESRQGMRPVVDPDISVEDYSKRWLGVVQATLKRATYESYSDMLRLHVLTAFRQRQGSSAPAGQDSRVARRTAERRIRPGVRADHAGHPAGDAQRRDRRRRNRGEPRARARPQLRLT